MLKLWNLYLGLTPEDDQEALKRLIGSRFPSFTLQAAQGQFRGEQENTYIIGVATDNEVAVWGLADLLRSHYDQEGVGVVCVGTYGRCTRPG